MKAKTKPKRREVWIAMCHGCIVGCIGERRYYLTRESCENDICGLNGLFPGTKPTRFVEAPKARRKRG